VSTPRDDDALSWEGDDDPSLDVGSAQPARAGASSRAEKQADAVAPRLPAGFTAVGRGSETIAVDDDVPALGSVGLVAIGMIAMASIVFAAGWVTAGLRLLAEGLPVPDVAVASLAAGAAIGPLLWFATVLALTRRAPTWARFAWLVLFIPWPYLITGALA
jgi:hypothetical protein